MSSLRTVAYGLIAAELGILVGPHAIRVAAGLALVFLLPGLAVTGAILREQRIEVANRALLITGMSLAIAILIGLLLYAAHLRLTTRAWALALGLVTAGGLLFQAVYKGGDIAEMEPKRQRRWPLTLTWSLMLGAAALLVAGAVIIGILGERHSHGPGFTELWALRKRAGNTPAVQLGVQSHERHEARYRVRISVGDRVIRVQSIELRPGETWQTVQMLATAGLAVEVALVRTSDGQIYRSVHLAPS